MVNEASLAGLRCAIHIEMISETYDVQRSSHDGAIRRAIALKRYVVKPIMARKHGDAVKG